MAEQIEPEDTFDGRMEKLKKRFQKIKLSGINVRSDTPERGDEYNMKHLARGFLILFNVENSNLQEKREGTDIDARALKETFALMGFEVDYYKDPTGDDVIKTLENVAKQDHTHMDCVAVGFLSHGWQCLDGKGLLTDEILTRDMPLKIEKLTEPFRMKPCHPSLRGKPKLFFIQTCRGGKVAEPAVYFDDKPMYSTISPDTGIKGKENHKDTSMRGEENPEDETDNASGQDENKGAETSGQDENKGAETSGQDENKGAETSGQDENKGAETSGQDENKGAETSGQDENKGAEMSGQDEDKGDEDEGDETSPPEKVEGAGNSGLDEDVGDEGITGEDRLKYGIPEKMPFYKDFLVAWSTAPGYFSFRNEETGTVFIQRLCQYLKMYHATADLLSILTWCNSEIAHGFKTYAPSTVNMHEKKQMPWYFSRLTKEVYFLPKPKESLLEQTRPN